MSFTDADLFVRRYDPELAWATEEALSALEKNRILARLQDANMMSAVSALGSKNGVKQFRKWRGHQIKRMQDLDDAINDKKLTVFERLIKRKRKTRTVFDALIESRRE